MTFGRPAAIPDSYVKLELPASHPDLDTSAVIESETSSLSLSFFNASMYVSFPTPGPYRSQSTQRAIQADVDHPRPSLWPKPRLRQPPQRQPNRLAGFRYRAAPVHLGEGPPGRTTLNQHHRPEKRNPRALFKHGALFLEIPHHSHPPPPEPSRSSPPSDPRQIHRRLRRPAA